MDLAIFDGEINVNPSSQNLNKIIVAPNVIHHPALTDENDIKQFISDLNDARPSVSKSALVFMMLTPLRTSTIRQLTWDDVKEKNGLMYLHIPAHKMKMRKDVQIALGNKAKELLDIQFKNRFNNFIFGLH